MQYGLFFQRFNMVTYDQAFRKTLDHIYSFIGNSRSKKQISAGELPLVNMLNILEEVGNPHKNLLVIHVAGTKGKGSTASFIANALIEADYNVGLYTSPHLIDFCERIQINNQKISPAEIVALVDEIRPILEEYPDTNTFEIMTLLAFLYFSRQSVDLAVMEVGLGGRLDPTNVVAPLVSVITSVSYDHMEILGDSLEKIAYEKGGIIKPNTPVVISKQKPEVYEVLRQLAQEKAAKLIDTSAELEISQPVVENFKQRFTLIDQEDCETEFTIPLLGLHQVENAATAYAALLEVRRQGIALDQESIFAGFAKVQWMARFEFLAHEPTVVVDGAHNVDSIKRLIETVKEVLPNERIVLLFGASKGKDLPGMLSQLLPMCEHVIFSKSEHPKASEPEVLVELAQSLGYTTQAFTTVEEALKAALSLMDDSTALLATGSLFFAAAIKDIWENK
jgi:dihydrofolate synthase / folylpolyglutamate synthase